MSIFSSLLLSSALLLRPDTDLRIYNPHDAAAEATLTCDGASRALTIDGRGFADVANASRCTSLESDVALTTFETRGPDVQRVLETDAACEAGAMYAPLFACKGGTGTAAVPVVDGATYSWSVEGATIVGGAGTPRVSLAFGEAGNVTVTCTVTTAECSSTASAVVGVRPPIDIAALTVPQNAAAGTPVTITWSYGATSPASQLLVGDAFEEPIALPAGQRSLTFTPKTSGARHVELRASYFAAMSAEVARPGKRRAAGRSAATATDCAVVAAERTIDVQGCSTSLPLILAPQEVDAGEEFQASVPLQEGEESRWSVENGTILVADDLAGRAQIRAGASGDLFVTVSVVRGACSREGSRTVRVIPAAAQCSVAPIAMLTYLSHDCARARVKATFTGEPPFRGVWSDGVPFQTTSHTLEHEFRSPGTYGMTEFRDASCAGVVSGSPQVASFRATASLSVEGGACTNGTLVARLTGTPPFTFVWFGPNERTWVTTNEFEVRRPLQPHEYGDWFIEAVSDSSCVQQSDSSHLTILTAPHAEVMPGPLCQTTPQAELGVSAMVDGPGPYSVTWSDGVVTNDTDPYLFRPVPALTTPSQEYTMVSAMSGGCHAILGNPTARILYRTTPRIDQSEWDGLLCPGETGTATLTEAPPAGSTMEWTVPGGEIISGQGTGTITFRGTSVTDSLIRATAVYPDGECSTFDHVYVRFHGIPEVTDFRVEPATIRAGGTAVVRFTRDSNLNGMGIATDPQLRGSELDFQLCTTNQCQAIFTDTRGPGTVTFELQYSGHCTDSYKSVYTTLTITP